METAGWHYNRALELERQGHYEEAVAAYREAATRDPHDADAQVRLGLLLRELGRDAEANQAFETALALKSGRSPGSPRDRPAEPPLTWSDRGVASDTIDA